MSFDGPIPVIGCGQSEFVGSGVIAGLKPEYEVIHFLVGEEECLRDLPLLLTGKAPGNPSSTLGSGNMSRPAVAVILGGAYAKIFDSIHERVEKALEEHGGSRVAWLRHDTSKPSPPVGPEYMQLVMNRTKETLNGLAQDGTLGNGKMGVYLY